MKKSELRQIIKEEIKDFLNESLIDKFADFIDKVRGTLSPKQVAYEVLIRYKKYNLDIRNPKVKQVVEKQLAADPAKEEFYKLLKKY